MPTCSRWGCPTTRAASTWCCTSTPATTRPAAPWKRSTSPTTRSLSHAEFRDKHGLSITLLSDPEGDVCRQYGVLQQKEAEGVRRECLVRSTFVIDGDGVVRKVFPKVKVGGHAAEVLEAVKALAK